MRPQFGFFSLLLASVLALVGCSKSDEATSGTNAGVTKVVLQLNWKPEPEFGGFYAAQQQGLFTKHGLEVDIQESGGAGNPTIVMAGSGTVPFAIVNGDELVVARSRGIDVVALFAVYQTNPMGLMTPAKRGIKNIAEIFNRPGVVAMQEGLPFSQYLKKKYTFDKVSIQPCPFADLTAYRTQDEYAMQVYITSEPLMAKRIGIEPTTFSMADSGYNPYMTVVVTSGDYYRKNKAICDAMIAASKEGWNAYLAQPEKINEVMHKLNPTMELETFAACAKGQESLVMAEATQSAGVGSMTVERWKVLIDQLLDAKVIEKPVSPESCIAK